MKKIERLKKLEKEIRNCKKCPLWKTRTNPVPGEGPPQAKIMIIGQAPGKEEDLSGRPFVGRAGKFLNQLLKLAKIKREEIFITSPIKCFPPQNRKPTRKEILACLPYLLEQIEIINPQKIILLGEVPFSIFFRKQRLEKFRGKWIKKEGRQFFLTYHPAAGMRFPRIKKVLIKDFKYLAS